MELTKAKEQLKFFRPPSLFFHFEGQELLQKYSSGFLIFFIPGGEANNTKPLNYRSNAWKHKSQSQWHVIVLNQVLSLPGIRRCCNHRLHITVLSWLVPQAGWTVLSCNKGISPCCLRAAQFSLAHILRATRSEQAVSSAFGRRQPASPSLSKQCQPASAFIL